MDKTILAIGGVTLVIIGVIGYLTFGRSSTKTDPNNPVISQTGIHWHAGLSIVINGQPVEIPANIGIGETYANTPWFNPVTQESDVHTHDTTGQIHWEVENGPVTTDHVKIGSFFTVWGKTFSQNQILDYTNGESGTVKMLVNDQPNTEFDRYVIHDGDRIEIRYE